MPNDRVPNDRVPAGTRTDHHWFEPLARFLGPAYLKNAFTRGTAQEAAFLWEVLQLRPGARVLDVGCGPGRHSLALAGRGADVVGVDISEEFVALARDAARDAGVRCTFDVADARELDFAHEFDAVLSLCQGAFGLPEDATRDDRRVFSGMVRSLRAGGRVALSAFSAYFAVRFLEDGEHFDAETGVHHERARLRDVSGAEREFDLWTSCWTPRELRLLAQREGLVEVEVHGVEPGKYAAGSPSLESIEFLLLASVPGEFTRR